TRRTRTPPRRWCRATCGSPEADRPDRAVSDRNMSSWKVLLVSVAAFLACSSPPTAGRRPTGGGGASGSSGSAGAGGLDAARDGAATTDGGDGGAAIAKQPNIIFVLVDDMGWGDLGV